VRALQPHQRHFHDTGETSSDSTSGHTSRGSGSHSPHLSSVPRCVRYNPISVTSIMQARIRKMSSDGTSDGTSHGSCLTPGLSSVRALQPRQHHFHDAGKMSSSNVSSCTSRGSGSHSPRLASVPQSVRYNTISIASMPLNIQTLPSTRLLLLESQSRPFLVHQPHQLWLWFPLALLLLCASVCVSQPDLCHFRDTPLPTSSIWRLCSNFRRGSGRQRTRLPVLASAFLCTREVFCICI